MLPRRMLLVWRALGLVALLGVVSRVEWATAQTDPRQKREELRQQQAQAASDVDALKADSAAVQRALAALQANVAGQEALLADATLAANIAQAAADRATAAADAARGRVAALRGQLREQAVSAYVDGRPEEIDDGASSSDSTSAVLKDALLRMRAGQAAAVLDQLRAAEEDAAIAEAEARDNAAIAEQKRAEIAQRTTAVRAARDQQAQYATQVEARLDRRLSEAAALQGEYAELSRTIAAEEAAIAARLRGLSGPSAPFTSGNISLTTVDGITVASEIADQLHRMIQAASADGIQLSGSGYRDPAQQQALREAHCPNPATDPPSACTPPTARPGTSMHERGLAVDFRAGGSLITSQSNPGFRWLAAHASAYGFYNLPSEPWHWSTTGD